MTAVAEAKESLSLDVNSPFDGSLIETIQMQMANDAQAMLNSIIDEKMANRKSRTWLLPCQQHGR